MRSTLPMIDTVPSIPVKAPRRERSWVKLDQINKALFVLVEFRSSLRLARGRSWRAGDHDALLFRTLMLRQSPRLCQSYRDRHTQDHLG